MMGTAKDIHRIGALMVASGIRNRHTATRMKVSIGVATVVVMAMVVPVPDSTVSPAVRLAASTECTGTTAARCALIMGTSGVPTPDDAYVENVRNRFIAPTHPGQIDSVKVTTPEGLEPFAGGLGRLASLLGVAGDPEIFGPGGPAWDVPWWNLTGLFDLTLDQSIQAGVGDLEDAIADAMAAHPDEPLVVFGYSQSALIANRVKRNLAEQYPAGTDAPDIDFVLGGDENLPNGGLFARFPGLYIPILDWTFNGPAPTDTQFDTVEITRQYDFMGDFPLYPLNLVADLNALLGFLYVHLYPFDVSLAPDPSTSPPIKTQYGDTTYYFFETQHLPLFAPLRSLGVPESVIDVVEPFFRVIVDLGYDRSIPPWEPTPARLIPTTLDPGKVIIDLVGAVGEGLNNAAALVGLAPLPSIPAPVTLAAPADDTVKAAISPQVRSINAQSRAERVPSTEPATESGQISTATATSTKDVTETDKKDEASTETTAVSAPEPSDSHAKPETPKPTVQPTRPRSAVRDSLRVGEQLRDMLHRVDHDRPTTQAGADGNETSTAAASSAAASSAASSSTSSSSRGASGGDGDSS